jgi:hypothetical protein
MRARKDLCPSEDALLRFSAGDLPDAHAARIDDHLRNCSQCSEQLRRWTTVLRTYRTNIGGRDSIPSPDWDRLDAALRDAELHEARRSVFASGRRWRSALAVAALLLAAVVWWSRAEVALDAEEVITRSIQHEQQHSRGEHVWIRVRSAPAAATREVDSRFETAQSTLLNDQASQPFSERAADARELAERLRPYGFSSERPLSARPFQRWRENAPSPLDALSRIDPALLKLSTSAQDGGIRHAEIVVRENTYELVRLVWRFADGLEVELSESPNRTDTAPSRNATTSTTEPNKAVAARTPDLDAVELKLRAALHQLNAPVGRGLSIRREGDRVRVEGTVPGSPLAERVSVYAHAHEAVVARIRAVENAETKVSASPALATWLQTAFGRDDLRRDFPIRLGQLRSHVQDSAAAFGELADRYRPDVVSQLTEQSRDELLALAEAKYRELTHSLEVLERHLAPLCGTVARPRMPARLPDRWQDRAAGLNQPLATFIEALDQISALDAATREEFENAAREAIRPALERLAFAVAGEPAPRPQTP